MKLVRRTLQNSRRGAFRAPEEALAARLCLGNWPDGDNRLGFRIDIPNLHIVFLGLTAGDYATTFAKLSSVDDPQADLA